jgi:D-glycero-alpha-D-manno-heptose-7-phosphate kinase
VTINKYVYLTINPSSYHLDDFIIKYRETEVVHHPKDLVHDRFKVALLETGLTKGGLEISSLADLPAGTGLGSSSTFLCALLKGISAYQGHELSKEDLAREACQLEIEVLKAPIGKQDQYAAAHGGFNVIQFNSDDTVDVMPINMPRKTADDFQSHLLLFYTGVSRDANVVLTDQQKNIEKNFEKYKKMSDSVLTFKNHLLKGDFKSAAGMLHEGWLMKKSLSDKISNKYIDSLYEKAIKSGAWGGKVLGAGGGGCLLFIAPPEKHVAIRNAMKKEAAKNKLKDFREIDFSFSDSGAEVLFKSNS